MQKSLNKLIAPVFYKLHHSIKEHEYTHYWLKGGRGSTKSSFISIEIVIGIMKHKERNGIVFRKVGNYLGSSVYEQIIWAIDKLDVNHLWRIYKAPLMLEYLPTGQKILFRGADDPKKTKSIKLRQGYFAYVWYEELDEFSGIDEINIINQSLLRGGSDFWVFYSYNPPKSQQAWVNYEATVGRKDKVVHTSNYLDVPAEWLGEQFIIEAETCKAQNYKRYLHEFIGIAIGVGGSVFDNVYDKTITDDEINSFKTIRHGADFGFAIDPFCFLSCSYDRKMNDLYVFDEIYQIKLLNTIAIDMVKKKLEKYAFQVVIGDSSEPETIATYRHSGVNMYGAKKGPGSVNYGINFLQSINHIYVDRKRCPNVYKELVTYEYEQNRAGEFISAYPDKNNHAIDALRYALQNDMPSRGKGIRIMK